MFAVMVVCIVLGLSMGSLVESLCWFLVVWAQKKVEKK